MLNKQHQYYLSKAYKILNDYTYDFFLIKIQEKLGIEGMTNGEQIFIDPRGQLLPTVLHECLHEAFPTWSEDKVDKTEKFLSKNMSDKQQQNLLIKFSNRI